MTTRTPSNTTTTEPSGKSVRLRPIVNRFSSLRHIAAKTEWLNVVGVMPTALRQRNDVIHGDVFRRSAAKTTIPQFLSNLQPALYRQSPPGLLAVMPPSDRLPRHFPIVIRPLLFLSLAPLSLPFRVISRALQFTNVVPVGFSESPLHGERLFAMQFAPLGFVTRAALIPLSALHPLAAPAAITTPISVFRSVPELGQQKHYATVLTRLFLRDGWRGQSASKRVLMQAVATLATLRGRHLQGNAATKTPTGDERGLDILRLHLGLSHRSGAAPEGVPAPLRYLYFTPNL
jgi:hypothetical protein